MSGILILTRLPVTEIPVPLNNIRSQGCGVVGEFDLKGDKALCFVRKKFGINGGHIDICRLCLSIESTRSGYSEAYGVLVRMFINMDWISLGADR